MDEIIEFLKAVYEWRWLFISVAVIMASVQGFKAVIKHYGSRIDKFERKGLTFAFALIAGFYITSFFMAGHVEEQKWAMAVAALNPIIYMLLLAYATKKRWLRLGS